MLNTIRQVNIAGMKLKRHEHNKNDPFAKSTYLA